MLFEFTEFFLKSTPKYCSSENIYLLNSRENLSLGGGGGFLHGKGELKIMY